MGGGLNLCVVGSRWYVVRFFAHQRASLCHVERSRDILTVVPETIQDITPTAWEHPTNITGLAA